MKSNNSAVNSATSGKNWVKLVTAIGTPPFYIVLGLPLLVIDLKLAAAYTLAIFLTELVCAVIKLVTRSERPIPIPRTNWYSQYEASSFPSAHTARIASNVSIVVLAFPSLLNAVLAFVLIMAVAWSRVALKAHFRIDVVAGTIVGLAMSLVTYHWILK